MAPALQIDPALLLRAQGLRVVFFDVDGVLTDGGLYFGASGETLKRFNTLDGQGLTLLQKAGITPAVITGRRAAGRGDAGPDLPLLRRSAFACAPANAQIEVRHAAHFVTRACGGDG